MGINLKDITQGSTYIWRLEFYSDAACTSALDVSGHSFSMIAEDSTGANVITLADAAFVQTSTSIRTVTLSAATTAGYTAGSLKYQVEVTLPDATIEKWMSGYITVKSEVV